MTHIGDDGEGNWAPKAQVLAFLGVLLLIGGLTLACIGGIALLGPLLAHGNDMDHADGSILSMGPGKDFALQTATGKVLHFHCGLSCRASAGHMQRHMHEHAHTDVYYISGTNNNLLAVDVD